MNIEALNNVLISTGASGAGDNNPQSLVPVGQAREAFTTTLQAQVQRLSSAPLALATTTTSPVVVPISDATTEPPVAVGDTKSVFLQAIPTVDLKSLIPELRVSDGAASAQPVNSANQTVGTDMLPVRQSTIGASPLDTATTPPNSVIEQAASGAPMTEEMLVTQFAATKSNLPKALVDHAIDSPMGQASPLSTFDSGIERMTANTALSENASSALAAKIPTIAQPMIQDAPSTTRLAVDNSNLSIQQKLALILKQNSTETATMSQDATNVLTPAKKIEKSSTSVESSTGIMPLQLDTTNLAPMDTSLVKVPLSQTDALAQTPANPLDAAENSLLQAGLLQPDFVHTLKIEKPNTLLASTTNQAASALASLTSQQNALDSTVASTPLAEPITGDTLKNSLLVLSDPSLAQNAFTTLLNNLKPNDTNVSSDAGMTKSLANLATELSVLNPPVTHPIKAEIAPMNSHIYSARWNQELGTKIIWMTHQQISSAELKLNPEHLGPISVQINMQQDQASIAFTANSTAVKEMLEASIPKLRDMLQTQNLNLADVNILQHSFSGQGQGQSSYLGQNSEGQKRSESDAAEVSIAVNEGAEQIEQSLTLVSNGLVSIYA